MPNDNARTIETIRRLKINTLVWAARMRVHACFDKQMAFYFEDIDRYEGNPEPAAQKIHYQLIDAFVRFYGDK